MNQHYLEILCDIRDLGCYLYSELKGRKVETVLNELADGGMTVYFGCIPARILNRTIGGD